MAVLALLLAVGPIGCGMFLPPKTYDGSESFYDQHPEYRDKPTYMSPSDEPDPHAGRPF